MLVTVSILVQQLKTIASVTEVFQEPSLPIQLNVNRATSAAVVDGSTLYVAIHQEAPHKLLQGAGVIAVFVLNRCCGVESVLWV